MGHYAGFLHGFKVYFYFFRQASGVQDLIQHSHSKAEQDTTCNQNNQQCKTETFLSRTALQVEGLCYEAYDVLRLLTRTMKKKELRADHRVVCFIISWETSADQTASLKNRSCT